MDQATRENIERCRSLEDFEFDLDAAEQVWADAMKLPGAADRTTPRWYHGDLAAENLLVRNGALSAVLDFGGLSVGDPTVDLVVAWEVLDPPARELFRRQVGVDDATWLRGRAWALSITLMIWYYWTTMPRETSQVHGGGSQRPGRRGLLRLTPCLGQVPATGSPPILRSWSERLSPSRRRPVSSGGGLPARGCACWQFTAGPA